MGNYLLHILVMIGIYSILAYSINLVTGYGGLLNLCHAVFYGIGAYIYTLLSIGGDKSRFAEELLFSAHLPFLTALFFAALSGGLVALLIGFVALRFRGDFFVFTTLGFQMITFTVLYNWTVLSRGSFGIPGIARPTIFYWEVNTLPNYLLLVFSINALILPFLFFLYRSPFGLTLKALRENERAAESLGISPFHEHLIALVIAGSFAGTAGALYASYVTFIDPTSFSLQESIFLLALLLLGGAGNIKGPIVGVIVMTILPEILRFIGLPDSLAVNTKEIIYGLILIALMFYRPQGIAGEYSVR